jgi:streptogramin lyase
MAEGANLMGRIRIGQALAVVVVCRRAVLAALIGAVALRTGAPSVKRRIRVALLGVLALAWGALALAPGAQAKSGDLVVTQYTPPALVSVNPLTGHAHTLASGPAGITNASYLAFEPNGHIAVTDEQSGNIWIVKPSTGQAHVLALSGAPISNPFGIDTDAQGNLIVADYGRQRVVRISKTGHVQVLSKGPWVGSVYGIAVDRRHGKIFVLSNGAVYQLSPTGHRSKLASGPPLSNGLWAIARSPDGTLYVTDANNDQLDRVNPKTGAAHVVASLPGLAPYGVVAASNRIVYTTDISDGTISRVDVTTGHVAPVASGLTTPIGIAVQP